jgi:hypothetical protein
VIERGAVAVDDPGVFGPSWLSRGLATLLIAVGFVARVLPLTQGPYLLLRQPTEDGFLMLTVARNIALGLGMSTAQGTIPTNGVQPLSTLLDAICFALAGGDRTVGVALVMALSVLIAGASLVAMIRLGALLFAGNRAALTLTLLAAALWFASPVVVAHSMNGLETGLYFLLLLLTTEFFLSHASDPTRDLKARHAVGLGLLLGLTFWARNDAVFLALAMAGARLGLSWRLPALWGRRLFEMALSGATMAAVAAPWMIHNYLRFGSVVPISGKAEGTNQIGANLPLLPAKLAEFVTVVGAIPNTAESRPPIQLASVALVLAGVLAALVIGWRFRGRTRAAVVLGLGYSVLLAAYYGAFFGAPHFLSRYTAPISVFAAFLTVTVAAWLLRGFRLRAVFPLALALVAVGLDARHYRQSREHMHFQVVNWIDGHVAEDSWVGAIQSGTVGFFHDRTINLDGKTNPDALKARFADRMKDYIETSRIEYLADWEGIAEWEKWLAPTFSVAVDDPAQNLAVLKRRRP